MIAAIFNTFFYRPLLNALILLYQFIPGNDFGVAIIFLTLLIKVLMYPLNLKALRSQKMIAELEPKIKEIREKFKDNKERMAKETMALYSEAKINPLSGIFLILIQMPVLIGLYQVFSKAVLGDQLDLYSFVSHPGSINFQFLIFDLAGPNVFLALSSALLIFFQTKLLQAKTKTKPKKRKELQFAESFQKQMNYFFPLLTFFILTRVPSAISLYLIVSTAFSVIQAKYINPKPIMH